MLDISNGQRRVITLTNDGFLFGISSFSTEANFGDQQGVWKRMPVNPKGDDTNSAQGVVYAFNYDGDTGLYTQTARNEYELTFSGPECDTVEGKFTLYFFNRDGNGDPFDVDTADAGPFSREFTGTRISIP